MKRCIGYVTVRAGDRASRYQVPRGTLEGVATFSYLHSFSLSFVLNTKGHMFSDNKMKTPRRTSTTEREALKSLKIFKSQRTGV